MNKKLMIQGTASSVGKSLLVAALCRILREDGFRVAPFKSQNMALNSYVTLDGLEMGRAQVMQAEAAGIDPTVYMNPILLKPTSDQGSQVIVMGRPVGNMAAMDYLQWKERLLPVIDQAYARLAAENDVIVIEGAGSPAEINLKQKDLVNMGLAMRLGAPVLLAGDIDRGGVFASLYGTCALLDPEERDLIKGVVINKFRGDPKVLEPGLRQLEELIEKPVLGVVPFMHFNLDDEDSVTERFTSRRGDRDLHIQVVLLPRISNFTDFNPLELFSDLALSYIRQPAELDDPDILILPGSKNTIEDMLHLREAGWEEPIRRYVQKGGLLIGICGGFQMLGRRILDPGGVESSLPEVEGFNFLPVETVMEAEKSTRQVKAFWRYRDGGYFSEMGEEEPLSGYEIHMGQTDYQNTSQPIRIDSSEALAGAIDSARSGVAGGAAEEIADGAVNVAGNVFGTYLHGIFDNLTWTEKLLNAVRRRKGLPRRDSGLPETYRQHKEKEYAALAARVRASLDMDRVRAIIDAGAKG